ncbi:MAG: hypothetical protein M1816_004801 [Peltula sp. TS41687]|nr:MAG: hypothetical protein M1816_004801 [Peltula sp. TS41687]
MAISYESIVGSTPFKFLVGPDKKLFTVHAALVAHHSKPLSALVNGGMLEAKEGCAFLEDVDEQMFVRFSQYAYTGDYVAADPEILLDQSMIGTAQDEAPAPSRIEDSPPTDNLEVAAPDHFEALADAGFGASIVDQPGAEPSVPWGASRSKKKSKRATQKFFGSGDSDSSMWTTPSKKLLLGTDFGARTYPISIPCFQPRVNKESCENYTDVFLCHARLYVFAVMYDIEPLRNLCLHKLQRTLAKFTLFRERVGDIVELLRYAYDNTSDRDGQTDGLRSLLAHYAACQVEDLARSDNFELLFGGDGSFARDLVQYMLKRLD